MLFFVAKIGYALVIPVHFTQVVHLLDSLEQDTAINWPVVSRHPLSELQKSNRIELFLIIAKKRIIDPIHYRIAVC